jgi:holo-[acyl-carrier protein] synthase
VIVGVGTDIVDVERIAKVYDRQGEAFVKRVLSQSEQLELEKQRYPERFLAKRWALKEAVSKALGTGMAQGVCFKEMTIGHKPTGQPILLLEGATLKKANELGITDWAISVSDEKHHTVAFVVAESQT